MRAANVPEAVAAIRDVLPDLVRPRLDSFPTATGLSFARSTSCGSTHQRHSDHHAEGRTQETTGNGARSRERMITSPNPSHTRAACANQGCNTHGARPCSAMRSSRSPPRLIRPRIGSPERPENRSQSPPSFACCTSSYPPRSGLSRAQLLDEVWGDTFSSRSDGGRPHSQSAAGARPSSATKV